jgi:hypothetical protein
VCREIRWVKFCVELCGSGWVLNCVGWNWIFYFVGCSCVLNVCLNWMLKCVGFIWVLWG